MPKLTLDHESHIYRWKDRPVISVSQVIEAQHFYDPWYMEKGKAIHRMIELYLQDNLDPLSIVPEEGGYDLRPFLEAFQRFQVDAPNLEGIFDWKSGQKMKWHFLQMGGYHDLCRNGIGEDGGPGPLLLSQGIEIKGYHPFAEYCGTIDYVNTMNFYPRCFIVYLKDTGRYFLESIKDIRYHVKAFLILRSAISIREEYQI